jgi:hypothetical protein
MDSFATFLVIFGVFFTLIGIIILVIPGDYDAGDRWMCFFFCVIFGWFWWVAVMILVVAFALNGSIARLFYVKRTRYMETYEKRRDVNGEY